MQSVSLLAGLLWLAFTRSTIPYDTARHHALSGMFASGFAPPTKGVPVLYVQHTVPVPRVLYSLFSTVDEVSCDVQGTRLPKSEKLFATSNVSIAQDLDRCSSCDACSYDVISKYVFAKDSHKKLTKQLIHIEAGSSLVVRG